MKITDCSPHEVINVHRYRRGLDAALARDERENYLADYLETANGLAISTRLVVNRYGDREDDFAGEYLLDVQDFTQLKSRRNMQPGMMMVRLALAESARTEDRRVKPANYYVSPRGILFPTGRLKWMLYGNEEGYFPTNHDDTGAGRPESEIVLAMPSVFVPEEILAQL